MVTRVPQSPLASPSTSQSHSQAHLLNGHSPRVVGGPGVSTDSAGAFVGGGADDKRHQRVVTLTTAIVLVTVVFTVLIGAVLTGGPGATASGAVARQEPPCLQRPTESPTPTPSPLPKGLRWLSADDAAALERELEAALPEVRAVSEDAAEDAGVPLKRASYSDWLAQLRASDREGRVLTRRVVCHEGPSRGQTCAFEGMICIDVRATDTNLALHRPHVMFVDDSIAPADDGAKVPSDDWCSLRHQSADPRYYSSRHWPFLRDTVVPQHSCMNATYHRSASVLPDNHTRVAWVPALALVDLDYPDNDHNTHLALDTLWLLDAALRDDTVALRPRPGFRPARSPSDRDGMLLRNDTALYLPQTRAQFAIQTLHDVNKLMWALVLRKDATMLYPNISDLSLKTAPEDPVNVKREAAPFLEAFPELVASSPSSQSTDTTKETETEAEKETEKRRFHFHGDIVRADETDLVCTARLTAGVKTGFATHERVCREIRTKAYHTYGVERPPIVRIGQIIFPQPQKSVLVLNRHQTRSIANADDLTAALRARLTPLGIAVHYQTTKDLVTAEDWVRIFSSAGIIITPHGSHNMGTLFMQRYSALIEIMPAGYHDYSFSQLAEICKVWYYDVSSVVAEDKREAYMKNCSQHVPHLYNPCNEVKKEAMTVDMKTLFPLVVSALERMGYDTKTWLDNILEDQQ